MKWGEFRNKSGLGSEGQSSAEKKKQQIVVFSRKLRSLHSFLRDAVGCFESLDERHQIRADCYFLSSSLYLWKG